MKKHLCRALLALTLALAVTGTTLPTAWAAESEENAPLDCASALLMEAESGRVLFEYNADDRHAPASITKIMTMLLVPGRHCHHLPLCLLHGRIGDLARAL